METAKKRFRPAALSAATAVALVASLLSIAPAGAAVAAGDPSQPCAAPITLSNEEQQALNERAYNYDNEALSSELLCFSTAGSDPRPGGVLRVAVKPVYAGTQISYPAISWDHASGYTLFGATSAADGNGGWDATLKLSEGESGKSIHAMVSEVHASLPIHYELAVPPVLDEECMADETVEDKSYCVVEPESIEAMDNTLQVWDSGFRGADQNVGYVPAALGAVSISGEAVVTGTLSSKIAAGTKAQTVSYQWLRNGTPISKATGKQYKLVEADRNRTVSLRVTASNPGQPAVVKTSNGISKILGKLVAPNPRVSLVKNRIDCPAHNCTAKLQSKVNANNGARYDYQWYRNGKAIKGANKSSYQVKYKYSKKAKYNVVYTLKVTVSKAGYKTERQVSTSTSNPWVKLPV